VGLGNVQLLGAQFDAEVLNALRAGCGLYVHGHSAGGTNPGLLQAMAAGCAIAAHENAFNRGILGEAAAYFTATKAHEDLAAAWTGRNSLVRDHRARLEQGFRWPAVIEDYDRALSEACR